ncbi:uncharacterized protein LOC143911790 [Arctopsyche grandis]|uniref:uncharacterized protein LOC143911790 n=1 Tax=Arctopsyche grandis TaxID=121162 RepID=UPI00406DA33B
MTSPALVTTCLLLLSIKLALSANPPLLRQMDALPDTTIRQDFRTHPRNIDVDVTRQSLPKAVQKRKFVKHPILITKEDVDPQNAIVEDNVIVESNILRLIRPSAKKNEIPRIKRYEDLPHKRVTRGWNLQYVVVPQQYYYYKKKKPVRYHHAY